MLYNKYRNNEKEEKYKMINAEIKHFHDTAKCSAKIVDWATLNNINFRATEPLKYMGNYMDDDGDREVYALFSDAPMVYGVRID